MGLNPSILIGLDESEHMYALGAVQLRALEASLSLFRALSADRRRNFDDWSGEKLNLWSNADMNICTLSERSS